MVITFISYTLAEIKLIMENIRELVQIACLGIVWFWVGYSVASNSYRKRIKIIQTELERIKDGINKGYSQVKKQN